MRICFQMVIYLFLFCGTSLFATCQHTDSLRGLVRSKGISDSVRFTVNKQLARDLRVNLPDSALVHAREALSLANQMKSNTGIAESLNLIGTCFYYKGEMDSSLIFQKKAIAYAEKSNLPEPLAVSRNSAGIVLLGLGNYHEAASRFLEVLTHYKSLGDTLGQVRAIVNLGLVWKNIGNYEKALSFYREAQRLLSNSTRYDYIAKNFNNMGVMYVEMQRYDSAIIFLKSSLRISTPLNDNYHTSMTLSNIVFSYLNSGQPDSAAKYMEEAEKYSKFEISNLNISLLALNRGHLMIERGEVRKGIEEVKKALEVATTHHLKNRMLDCYRTLSFGYNQLGDYRAAFTFERKASAVSDSLKNENITRRIAALQLDHEMQEKQKDIQRLEQQSITQAALLQAESRVKNLLVILLAVVLVVTGLMGYAYRTKIRYNKKIARKNEELEEHRALLESINEVLKDKSLKSQMNPHFVFNSLNSIQHLILKHDTEHAYNYLSKFGTLLRKVLEFVDSDSISLNDEVAWLELYLQLESLRFNNEFHYRFNYFPDENAFTNAIVPPLVIQPFIENAIVHGLLPKKGDRELSITFSKENESVNVVIRDNGIGRHRAMKTKKTHTSRALQLIRTRFEVLTKTSKRSYEYAFNDLVDNQGAALGTEVKLKLG